MNKTSSQRLLGKILRYTVYLRQLGHKNTKPRNMRILDNTLYLRD